MKKEVFNIIKRSKVEVTKNISVLILKNDYEARSKLLHITQEIINLGDWVHCIQGPQVITAISPEKHVDLLKAVLKGKVIEIKGDLVQVLVKSPSEIYTTQGVLAGITSLLLEEKVNIIEFLSCYTDTIIIIEKEDLTKALSAFSK